MFPIFSSVAAVRDACSLSGDVSTCETMSSTGTATTSSTGATVMDVSRRPVKLVGELAGFAARVPVVVRLKFAITKFCGLCHQ